MGKSTLIRTLARFEGSYPDPPPFRTSGTVTYLGDPWPGTQLPTLVTQHARLLLNSVHENIIGGLPQRGLLTRAEQRMHVSSLLERVGLSALTSDPDREVMSLSLGVRRRIAFARALATSAPLVCLDEPTASLDDGEREEFLDVLEREAKLRAFVLITHNRQDALRLGGRMALMSGGTFREVAEVSAFFTSPSTDAGRRYVETGGCIDPSPDATADELDESFVATHAELAPESLLSPTPLSPTSHATSLPTVSTQPILTGAQGFRWVIPDALGGMPRPGLLNDLVADIDAISRLQITALLNLEEEKAAYIDVAMARGIQCIHMPIVDMAAPTITLALEICETVANILQCGGRVAVHCRAGLGRTGTVLAAYLLWSQAAASAKEALLAIRSFEPRYVQSEVQERFLLEFETQRHALLAVQ